MVHNIGKIEPIKALGGEGIIYSGLQFRGYYLWETFILCFRWKSQNNSRAAKILKDRVIESFNEDETIYEQGEIMGKFFSLNNIPIKMYKMP